MSPPACQPTPLAGAGSGQSLPKRIGVSDEPPPSALAGPPISERGDGLLLRSLAEEVQAHPGLDGWRTVENLRRFSDFTGRFRRASPGAQFWAIDDGPAGIHDDELFGTVRAFAGQLAVDAGLRRPNWTLEVEP